MHVFDMTLRIAESMGLGALIGFERQYRSRMAGLRTNALVAVGACCPHRASTARATPRGSPPRWCPASVSWARA